MLISVINHTNGTILDEDVQRVVRAINTQIETDFEPYWSMGARLRLEGKSQDNPDTQNIEDMRGDAVLYLWNDVDVDNALGYHARNFQGVPFGFVFTGIAEQLGEPWSVTLSHEALELIADPEVNLLVDGPHPDGSGRFVFHWYEMCDAVQAETYEIDGVQVSNFVLPLYFTGEEERGGRNDFLGRRYDGETLRSFGINPGGYVGFFDPVTGSHETYSMRGDANARRRLEIKREAALTRRSVRYGRHGQRYGPAKGDTAGDDPE